MSAARRIVVRRSGSGPASAPSSGPAVRRSDPVGTAWVPSARAGGAEAPRQAWVSSSGDTRGCGAGAGVPAQLAACAAGAPRRSTASRDEFIVAPALDGQHALLLEGADDPGD